MSEINYFSINDSDPTKTVVFTRMVTGIRKCFDPNVIVISRPLIISTHHEITQIAYENKYFYGNPVPFTRFLLKQIKENNNCVFFVIVKYFGPVNKFYAHTIVCSWQNNSLYIFDPNGDTTDNNDIYAAPGYRNTQLFKEVNNPVYKTLLKYFLDIFTAEKIEGATVHIYDGEMLSCTERDACNLKSILYIIGLHKYKYDIAKAIAYATETSINPDKMTKLLLFVKYTYEQNEKVYKKLLADLES
jgi:hypothetical protein